LAYITFTAKLGWSIQQMLRVLQLNLFMRRDLMARLRGDPPPTDTEHERQLCLIYHFCGTAVSDPLILERFYWPTAKTERFTS
jgi:hypothetical protein